jgi:4-amino-4-deoxy-L-arabinose transferase-like glycosyltransferase
VTALVELLVARTATRRQRRVSTALAAGLACVVLLPLLGHKPLAEWDEGIYAEVAREMLGGSWLVPHWNYQPWFEKPPLTMWITAVFFKLFGVSAFWARAGSALAGVGIVALLHGWLARRRDLLTAWASSVMLLATAGFLHVCHVGETDTLLAFGTLLALIGLSEVELENGSGWLLFWVGLAIAVMSKGAAAVCIPAAAVVVIAASRWPARRFGWSLGAGALLFCALTLPWHVALAHRFGMSFGREYLGLHVLARASTQIEGHHTHWWYYVVVLLVSAPPFVLLYPGAVVRGWRERPLRAFAVFAVLEVVFFSVVQTRLPHYIAPVYPVLSLLSAVVVADWLKARAGRRSRAFWVRTGLAVAGIWVVLAVVTHPGLKGLHSADLAGAKLLDNREADALLGRARVQVAATPGPLLVWRNGPVQSIATLVFHSGRRVEQVELNPDPARPADRYMNQTEPLDAAVGSEPELLLLEQALVPKIPPGFRFSPIASSRSLVLGTIARAGAQ